MTMSEEAKALRRAYQREYRHTHPEQAEKQREYTRQWKRRNREKCREYQQRYWEKKAAQEIYPPGAAQKKAEYLRHRLPPFLSDKFPK